jgi:hypothetical protein
VRPTGSSFGSATIADVREGFADIAAAHAGSTASRAMSILTVLKKGDEDAVVKMAEMVKAYVAGRTGESIELTWRGTGLDAAGGGPGSTTRR